jgi:TetR/AcrR family transcriptional repressor of nem operon
MSHTTVADVMAAADLTIGGFYAHFPSKEALAEAAIHEGLQERRELFLARSDHGDWRDRLASALAGYFTADHRDNLKTACPMPMAAADAARDGLAVGALVDEMERMAEAFQTGRDPDHDAAPREAALGSLALMIGGMIVARATRGTPLSDEMLGAARAFGDAALAALARRSEGPRRRRTQST